MKRDSQKKKITGYSRIVSSSVITDNIRINVSMTTDYP